LLTPSGTSSSSNSDWKAHVRRRRRVRIGQLMSITSKSIRRGVVIQKFTDSSSPYCCFPRHVARLVKRLVAPLVVDNSASRRLIVDYFASAARPGASARRAARHAASRAAHHRLLRLAQACCRLLRLRRASGCLGSSRG
jgi:hypothetical protein